jgi:hypothetical protein
MRATDSVLVVDDIARAATRISSTVTITRIDGALHDVFLSGPDARARAFDALDAGTSLLHASALTALRSHDRWRPSNFEST